MAAKRSPLRTLCLAIRLSSANCSSREAFRRIAFWTQKKGRLSGPFSNGAGWEKALLVAAACGWLPSLRSSLADLQLKSLALEKYVG